MEALETLYVVQSIIADWEDYLTVRQEHGARGDEPTYNEIQRKLDAIEKGIWQAIKELKSNQLAERKPELLTERERELIGWALRKTVVEPGFVNEKMKSEVRDLANRLDPIVFSEPEGP